LIKYKILISSSNEHLQQLDPKNRYIYRQIPHLVPNRRWHIRQSLHVNPQFKKIRNKITYVANKKPTKITNAKLNKSIS
jgi:hypothetical protein